MILPVFSPSNSVDDSVMPVGSDSEPHGGVAFVPLISPWHFFLNIIDMSHSVACLLPFANLMMIGLKWTFASGNPYLLTNNPIPKLIQNVNLSEK